MTLKLVAPDHDRLWEPCPEFHGRPGDLRITARFMHELLHRSFGVGLAAPQVGLRLRMFVLDCRPYKYQQFGGARICINPTVLAIAGGPMEAWEGCLTWPGKTVKVVRSEHIAVEYTDLRGKRIREELFGVIARGFQHERDHLDGKNIFARASAQPEGPPAPPPPGPLEPPVPPPDRAVSA